MADTAPQTIYLKDYRAPAFWVEEVALTFKLDPAKTRVLSRIKLAPNAEAPGPFFLHGEELELIQAKIDGAEVTPEKVEGGITCAVPEGPFVWEAEVEIDPQGNTALEGLYMSGGMYCTQCEAEGFRKITYYPDRPDVMAPFTVRIESDFEVLLSNGNPGTRGEGFAEWHDPWPKPAYLFALVAGNLTAHHGAFTTASGKEVALNIWTRPGPDEAKRDWGMEALKASMVWDEQTYGREYDLDVFNIVAVDDFNMGAMENKGLNIFNSSCVLASPETSTDGDFERIEAIIAHEYFHNWTGNRITCRDWFQLCLKEGLTVFRDQEFTSDMRSAAVKRIDDAAFLKAAQFQEDAGPLAHPVRPDRFVEINNFYTLTVYEKGAELIGMLKRLVGDDGYRRALDLYFERHDGQAATIEDWLTVFEDACGRDLGQFKRWYEQAGTPRVSVTEAWDQEAGRFTLTLAQDTPPTPGQDEKLPLVIPVAVGLLSPSGAEVQPTTVLELTEAERSFVFDGLEDRPTPSILREFSAPVILEHKTTPAQKAFILAHDTDPYLRWDAKQGLALDCLIAMASDGQAPSQTFLDGLHAAIREDSDPAFRANLLGLPGDGLVAAEMDRRGITPDPDRIFSARDRLCQEIGHQFHGTLDGLYETFRITGPYAPDAGSVAQRGLTNSALVFLTYADDKDTFPSCAYGIYERAEAHYGAANNMTDRMSALEALLRVGQGTEQLEDYQSRFQSDALAMNKWFGVQIGLSMPGQAVSCARSLTEHPDFEIKNPNRARSVLGALAGHHAGFHQADGSGYEWLADWLITLDGINPQTAARLSSAFQTWRRYDDTRQGAAQKALTRIKDTPDLSRDMTEMVNRILG